jgi:hypothetical protein
VLWDALGWKEQQMWNVWGRGSRGKWVILMGHQPNISLIHFPARSRPFSFLFNRCVMLFLIGLELFGSVPHLSAPAANSADCLCAQLARLCPLCVGQFGKQALLEGCLVCLRKFSFAHSA